MGILVLSQHNFNSALTYIRSLLFSNLCHLSLVQVLTTQCMDGSPAMPQHCPELVRQAVCSSLNIPITCICCLEHAVHTTHPLTSLHAWRSPPPQPSNVTAPVKFLSAYPHQEGRFCFYLSAPRVDCALCNYSSYYG